MKKVNSRLFEQIIRNDQTKRICCRCTVIFSLSLLHRIELSLTILRSNSKKVRKIGMYVYVQRFTVHLLYHVYSSFLLYDWMLFSFKVQCIFHVKARFSYARDQECKNIPEIRLQSSDFVRYICLQIVTKTGITI